MIPGNIQTTKTKSSSSKESEQTYNEIEAVIKHCQPGQDDFTEGFYQTIKELIPIFPEN